MAVFKCKECGGDLNVTEGQKICTCEFCESRQTVPNSDNEKKVNLFNRADRLRFNGEYDKAANIYESIAAEFPDEAESYWGLCLCKYGIEYVDDPATGKKVPTCHRTSYESIFSDSNFANVMKLADSTAASLYQNRAQEIDHIQKGILDIVKNESPYDIFICYKESTEDKQRTEDSVIAQDIYDDLTREGYKVFFSRITLEDKLGVEYEPYIFAALNSAKVMLAFGTKYEYFDAIWVKNEWSRFLALMKNDKMKMLIPCYRDIDPSEMPPAFRGLQGQDMSKLGFKQDLLRGIGKIIPKKKQNDTPNYAVSASAGAVATVESLLERVFDDYLASRHWDEACKACDRVLDSDPKNAEAFTGKLMADLRIASMEQLGNARSDYEQNENYIKACKYADQDFKYKLENYLKSTLYNLGISLYKQAYYDNAIKYFKRITDYKDSEEKISEIKNKILQKQEEKRRSDEKAEKKRLKEQEEGARLRKIALEGEERFREIYRKYDISYPTEHANETQQYIDKYNYLQKKYKFFPNTHQTPKYIIWFIAMAIGTVLSYLLDLSGFIIRGGKAVSFNDTMFACALPYFIVIFVATIVFCKKTDRHIGFWGILLLLWLGYIPALIVVSPLVGLFSVSIALGTLYTIVLAGLLIFLTLKAMSTTKTYNAELQILNNMYNVMQDALSGALADEHYAFREKYPDIDGTLVLRMRNNAEQSYKT